MPSYQIVSSKTGRNLGRPVYFDDTARCWRIESAVHDGAYSTKDEALAVVGAEFAHMPVHIVETPDTI